MITSNQYQTPGSATLSTGPRLSPPDSGVTDRGVHIIFVSPDVSVGELDGNHIAPAGQELLRAHIGDPAPTDVIVYARRPWHFARCKLQPHPEVHRLAPESFLDLHRAGPSGPERAVWWSEHDFTITTIEDEKDHRAREEGRSTTPAVDADPYPFKEKPITKQEEALDQRQIFVARSTVPIAAGHYKITFEIEGQSIDPNMRCF
jgi:hypothetical protein